MKALLSGAWLRHSRSLHISLAILLLLGGLGGLLALQTLRPAYAAGNLQINAGGGAASPFIADTDFSGGRAGTSTTKAIDTSKATNPAPQAVYQTDRVGNFTYTIPNLTAGASYTVRLHFAEIYWTAAGKRVFNVNINRVLVHMWCHSQAT